MISIHFYTLRQDPITKNGLLIWNLSSSRGIIYPYSRGGATEQFIPDPVQKEAFFTYFPEIFFYTLRGYFHIVS